MRIKIVLSVALGIVFGIVFGFAPGLLAPALRAQMAAAPATTTAKSVPTGVLTRDQASQIMPATVFYHGQSAGTQARNSGGIKLQNGKLVLFAMVDTSGYSSADQQTYQAYLITEATLQIGEKTLPPGAYGFGFLSGDRMVILDLGANQIGTAPTHRDAELKRPVPLQVMTDASNPAAYRLYLGRSYAVLRAVER